MKDYKEIISSVEENGRKLKDVINSANKLTDNFAKIKKHIDESFTRNNFKNLYSHSEIRKTTLRVEKLCNYSAKFHTQITSLANHSSSFSKQLKSIKTIYDFDNLKVGKLIENINSESNRVIALKITLK